ncbi:(3S,6E)-nerolidol synthase 1-like [Cucurbita moschata]|uniref:(3S,6E)-nerolidol synthase 1-like n=1 Tax=Cucurbita moschata TaxID=3662 RepID=A0A6J1FTJ8_CUCMO|nr:(3S,6E)-nerolidol synthase 1-like [Cucurbita moschata]
MASLLFFLPPPITLMSQSKIPKAFHNHSRLFKNPIEKPGFGDKKWSIRADSSSFNLLNFADGLGLVEAPAKLDILRHLLRHQTGDYSLECLSLIDATQRLGIDYHFQQEIQVVLQSLYVSSNHQQDTNLHYTCLLFRLLRQQGYPVSTDSFTIFLDNKGKFNQGLTQNVNGLMSLYEASQLCMHGDDILEEAETFSTHGLNHCLAHLDHHMAPLVRNTLAHPHHKSVAKFMVPNYFGDIQSTNKWIHVLQDVAKVDFNRTQLLHQDELVQFLKWWKETGLAEELKFARDEPIIWYIASLVCLGDSCYSQQRLQLGKTISFVFLIDDLFDVFGNLNELTLFTEAVYRWDLGAAKTLPDCMGVCLKSLFEVTNDISSMIYKKHGWNPIGFLSRAWGKLCKAFLVETEWMSCGYSPSAEEYLRNGIVSTGIHVILVHVFFLLGQQISHQTAELLEDDLDIISSTAIILRLCDDMGSAKDEKQVGRDGSYAKYYMNEHPSISHEATHHHVTNKISQAWKTLNKEYLLSNLFPAKFTQASLNIARAVPLANNYGSNQSFMPLEKLIQQLLFRVYV